MNNMGSLGKEMPFTKILMLLATLSLAGIPPFSGFWSKDAVFVASLAAGGEFGMILYLTAVITALITLIYSARYIFMVFHGEKSQFIKDLEHHGHQLHESPKTLTWPIATLVVIMMGVSILGLIGFFVPRWSPELYIDHQMKLTLEGIGVMRVFEENHLEFIEPHIQDVTKLTAIGSSALLIVIGASIIYLFWYTRKINSWEFVSKNPVLQPIHSFLWNRWYLNDLYYAVFVNGIISFAHGINGTIEAKLMSVNDFAPIGFTDLWTQVRKAQTGWLRVNILYIIGLITLLLFLFAIKWV
jgi:NADH-quinone oxidoreductase subunit L